MKSTGSMLIFLLALTFLRIDSASTQQKYLRTEKEAQQIIEKVLRTSPVIDGHNDLFAWYFGCSYKKLTKCPQDISDYPLDTISHGQTDIPRWRKGGVGGVLMNVFADSLPDFLDAYDLLYRLENTYKEDLEVVGSAADMKAAIQSGKIALVPMLEGSIRMENKTSYLRIFYKLGLRCITFTYYTGDWADGSDDTPKHKGLSALGKEMVKEMNRLGIIIDMSHISAEAMSDILDITEAPVIFSHSNARAICNVNRNVPDDILIRLRSNGGMIMLDMVAEHSQDAFGKWMREGDSLYFGTRAQFPGDKEKSDLIMKEWENQNPMPKVSIADVADHFDHVRKLIGVDHIGISGDYDGMDYPIPGLEDVSCFPNLLLELAKRGWTEKELKKITGENFLEVFDKIDKAKQLD